MQEIFQELQKVKQASKHIALLSHSLRNDLITELGKALLEHKMEILSENQKDLDQMDPKDPLYDRLLLNEKRILSMVQSCNDLVMIQDPLKKFEAEAPLHTQDGLTINKVSVPLGVVGCIYESRPNVTIDLIIMSIKSGNAVVLRGGTQAQYSNTFLVQIAKQVLQKNALDEHAIYQFPSPREDLEILFGAVGLVDVMIPRGGKALIESVRKQSLVPIIETGAGVVHLYIDSEIHGKNYKKIINLIINSKVQRPSVCNALDTLLIHKDVPPSFLEELFQELKVNQVQLICKHQDFSKEHLSLDLNICYVSSIDEAIKHIDTYSSKHSDGIISDSQEHIDLFLKSIDSSVVYVNTSTRFSDGSCYGFGGEIGISTQKLHARGPMGAESLVTYKYVAVSTYAIR